MVGNTPKIKYTVFLIKEEYTEFDEVIEEEKWEHKLYIKDTFDLNGIIYIGHNQQTKPSWYQELKKGIINPPEIMNQSTRAVMLIKRRGRIFAFTFGHGKHMIKPETYERGFGLKIVLNNCEINKLKSIDSSTVDSITVQARIQTSKSSDINHFEIDDTRDLLKAVTAESKDFDRYGKIIAGRDSFHFYFSFNFQDLKTICDNLIYDFNSEKYKDYFEWIDYLTEVKDPVLINNLNNELLDQINDIYENDNEYNIHLAPPEIINMEDNIVFSYKQMGQLEDELSLKNYIKEKKPRNNYTVNKLKQDKIYVYNSETNQLIDKWSIYNCLVAEIIFNDNYYVLTLGQWFLIDRDYVSEIDSIIQSVDNSNLDLLDYDEAVYSSENEYNQSISNSNSEILCMDKVNIVIDNNGKFELCDLLSKEKHLVHVKPWKSSSTLSHLFAQGRVSAETLVYFTEEVIPKINEKISEIDEQFPLLFDIDTFNPRDYTIVYAIIYEGDKEIHERLPFFSKLNFVHSIKTLRAMQFKIQKLHIKKKRRS
ncbi:MAG: TIGR04141 family sporadically distributed protein [Bacillaceae bacterium]|nr:TIGR04141 family sporadically distributed protein [Bacillaceae bacterium]